MQPLTGATSAGVNISLGMLNLTVSVHSAVGTDDSSSLRTVCLNDHPATPVRQSLACPECSNADASSFAKAATVGGGLVVVPPEVQEAAKSAGDEFKKQITLTMHPADEVSSVLLPSGKSYYLSIKAPNAVSRSSYTMLARIVQANPDTAFMGKFTLRSVTGVFRLTTAGEGTLVLQQMADAALVRAHPEIEFVEPSQEALDLGQRVVNMLVTPFVEAQHGSGKTEIIATYAAMQTPVPVQPVAAAPVIGATVTDMTAILEAMLAAGEKKSAKRAARKAPAKKAS